MDKRNKKEQDSSVTAFRKVEESTWQLEPEAVKVKRLPSVSKNPNAVALGRLGGLKGGKARAEKLTPERRREIAKKAAIKRWQNG